MKELPDGDLQDITQIFECIERRGVNTSLEITDGFDR